mgnify:FL=1|tara:strand:- start:481 stop:738 length:258 start_codon:yes stop_codon:yes gene_type:complete
MEESPNLPTIKVLALDKQENGELNIEFEVCDEFLEYAKFELGVDSISQKELGSYVKNMISKAINNEDDYSIKQNFTENDKTNIDK